MRLPDDTQRLFIAGRTGSGKTQAAAWHLAQRRFDLRPWVVIDYKVDSFLNSIPEFVHMQLHETPSRPGIYVYQPQPDDVVGVENFLWNIWAKQETGLYVDEGLMISSPGRPNKPYRSILTQGRSMKIPVITLSQRPAWLDRFVYTESEFFQIFRLQDVDDRKRVMNFVPADLDTKLPEFHSYYHDVAREKTYVVKPVPSADKIRQMFAARFEAMKEKPKRYIFV